MLITTVTRARSWDDISEAKRGSKRDATRRAYDLKRRVAFQNQKERKDTGASLSEEV